MSAEAPVPYRVTYSVRVQERLFELAEIAQTRGDGEAFAGAVEEFDRRLRIYPQFGDPLIDLKHEQGQIRIGVILPISMRYGLLEVRREVLVVALPVLLPMSH